MKRAQIYILLFAAVFAHVVFPGIFQIGGARIDLVLVITVFSSVYFGWVSGLEVGLVGGLFKDLFALDVFWTNSFVMGMTGLAAGLLSSKLNRDSRMTQSILVLLANSFLMLIHCGVSSFFLRSVYIQVPSYFWNSVLPSSIFTALVSIPVFGWLSTIYGPGEREDLL